MYLLDTLIYTSQKEINEIIDALPKDCVWSIAGGVIHYTTYKGVYYELNTLTNEFYVAVATEWEGTFDS